MRLVISVGKAVGKKAEPTSEELEFIYSRIAQFSDGEILEEMQETTFPLRSPGFIKRRRKEFNAAKKVLEVDVKKQQDPTVARLKFKHWADLAETAKAIRRNIGIVRADKNNLLLGSLLTGSVFQASISNQPRILKTELSKVDKIKADGLLEHLKVEYDLFRNVPDWSSMKTADIKQFSQEMFDKLDLVSRRRWFPGACRICDPWQ